MAVKELSATLMSRFIQDAGTKTTPGYHKTKLGDAREKAESIQMSGDELKGQLLKVKKLDTIEYPYWAYDF